MQIVFLGILKNDGRPAVKLACELELESFNRFTRSNYGEVFSLLAQTVAERTKPGQRQSVQDDEEKAHYMAHAYGRTEGICGILISDVEYPVEVAHRVLGQICDEFTTMYPRTAYADVTKDNIKNKSFPFSTLKGYIQKYQDPQQADSLTKIQKELGDTKIVLHKTIQSVLERGEKIDDLVAKSDGLSAQSKMFYTQAKKQNSCCTVM